MTQTSPAMPTLAELQAIRHTIAPYIHRTPTVHSRYLSKLTGYDVHLKAELFQRTGSFKPRGMLARLLNLSPAERGRGAITFSAGNAAQGLAFAGGIAGVPTTVVMPETASPIKAEATRGYGAKVVLHGTAADAYVRCMEICEKENLIFVPSFDDDMLMRGHASLGLELMEDVPDVEAVIIGIGGGGLIGGVAMAREALGAKFKLFGVEPEGAAGMTRSLEAGHAARLDKVATIADGLGAPFVGERCFPIVRDHVEKVTVLPDSDIVNAMKLLLSRCKLMAEGAGAASVAALIGADIPLPKGARVCCVVSGGNVDLGRLKDLI
jgi:threonine dehydratase